VVNGGKIVYEGGVDELFSITSAARSSTRRERTRAGGSLREGTGEVRVTAFASS